MSLTFTYDGDGNRATKSVSGGATTSFNYDTNQKLPVLLDDGNRLCVWGLDKKLSYSTKGSNTADVWVYHRDGVGSVRGSHRCQPEPGRE